MQVAVDVLVTGEMPVPADYAFRPDGPRPLGLARLVRGVALPGGDYLDSPCLAYVIRHPDAGVVLVDTGFHPDASADRRADFGRAMSLMFRSLRVAETPYTDQLRERGVDPDQVERVVMTHLHVDHTSGMRLLPNARYTISAAEWSSAHSDGSRGGFVAHHLPPDSRVDLVDAEADGEPHGPFRRTLDLLGDGSVRLVSTPGHTAGHLSVLLRTDGDRQVLLAGDAAYTLRSIEEARLPLLTVDDGRYARSLAELKAFMDDDPDSVVVPSHDPDAWRRLGQRTSPSTSALSSRSTLR